ncbi:MAG: hypothetical protein HYV60_13045 [Planctomycetia bacterium]|nr:hypothetical protein [Planctomycetia bacterium]
MFGFKNSRLAGHSSVCCSLCLFLVLFSSQQVAAQIEFESEPVNYNTAPTNDPVVKLQRLLDAGELTLKHDEHYGYLPSVLDALNVPKSSQMLVFSQTSFQLRRIAPSHPRAVYFTDDTYVGWVQDGDVLEMSTVDPRQGAIFYTLDQSDTSKPRFIRDRGQCITCHASSRTQGVPGHLVRSVFPDDNGRPLLGSGTYVTDHRSAFEQRWGGWYVSGTHGTMRHMGNAIARDRHNPEDLDREATANVTDLSKLVNVKPYLSPHSDLVALMVLEHQSQMHNYITFANYEARSSLHYDGVMNKALDRPDDYQSDTTKRRLDKACEKLVQYMLFADEFQLTSPVQGMSEFAAEFAGRGIRDGEGRSLREFDLQRRLFKYPCSYLIYSDAFMELPTSIKQRVYGRLREVLAAVDQSPEFAHLSSEDRQAIYDILNATHPEFLAAGEGRSPVAEAKIGN